MRRISAAILAAVLAGAAGSCTTTGTPDARSSQPGQAAFATSVKPLFEHRCVHCHSDAKPLAGLNLQDRSGTLAPERRFIVPGKPEESRLYRAVTLENAHPNVMPGDGWGITGEQEAALKAWIAEGAPWPEGRSGRIRKKSYRIETDDYL